MNKLILCLTATVLFLPTESHSAMTSKDCINAIARLNGNMADGPEKTQLVNNVSRFCAGYMGRASSTVQQLVQDHLNPPPAPIPAPNGDDGADLAGAVAQPLVRPHGQEGADAGFREDLAQPLVRPHGQGGADAGLEDDLDQLPARDNNPLLLRDQGGNDGAVRGDDRGPPELVDDDFHQAPGDEEERVEDNENLEPLPAHKEECKDIINKGRGFGAGFYDSCKQWLGL